MFGCKISYKTMPRVELIFVFIITASISILGQQGDSSNEPTFTPFNGTVYKIPEHRLMHGYKKDVSNYRVIKKISWDEINVSDRLVDVGFPDIDLRTSFGIIFHTKMTIPIDGYYQLSINSDDGSIVWVDNKLAVHNDYHHGMNMEENIIQLTEGIHEVKIWYYQAYENRFGIEFNAKFMKALPPAIALPRIITIQDEVLFAHDQYKLSPQANHTLDSLSTIIENYENVVINIDGHTDNKGTDEYNFKLSNDRSMSVMNALKFRNLEEKVRYISKGHSFHRPVATNDSEAGRQLNRRVVITITKDGSGEAYFKEKENY